jgi:glycosyltransferase involved in cell wall biosynthesis
MHLAWIAAPPWANTGYGKVTRNFITRMKYPEISCIATGGISSGPFVPWKDERTGKEFKVYPGQTNEFSKGRINIHGLEAILGNIKADMFLLHTDAWAFRDLIKRASQQFGSILYSPIDGGHISPEELEAQRAVTHRVAMCKYVANEYEKAGLPHTYIPHGVDTQVYKPMDKMACREKFGLPKDEFLIGFVGTNISKRKGQAEMVMALKKAYDAGKRFKVVCITNMDGISTGGYHFLNLCDYVGLPRDVLLFAKKAYAFTEQEMAEHFNAFDILYNASHGEGFGIPILESQACGTPVIGTDFSSMPELIDGHGWLAPVKALDMYTLKTQYCAIPDYDWIGDTLIKIIGNHDLIKSTGKRAHQFAQKYDWDKVAPEWDRMLRKLDNEGFFPPFRVKMY